MIVKQVQYALQILEFFANRQVPASLSQIADHFGWPRSSTFNLIETLSSNGLIYEPTHRGGYYPTHRLLKLAQQIIDSGPMSDELSEMVSRVAARTGETAGIAALSGQSAVFLEVVESSQPIRYFAQVGQRVPLPATSVGRALLSMLTPKQRSSLLAKAEYRHFAPAALMTPEEVEEEIARFTERGWFLNINGYIPELLGLAVPMPLEDRQFCLMMAGPAYRNENRLADLVDILTSEVNNYMMSSPNFS